MPLHIDPLNGWQPHSPYGLQRFKDGPDGRVVRLADVVRWLMQAREMSFASAVRAVCAPLEGNAPPLVYRLDPVEDAKAEDEPSKWLRFFSGTEDLEELPPRVARARLAARDMKASWLMKPHELVRLVNVPGGSTEYDETKETPFEFSERSDRVGGPCTLAVSFAEAHALWGWGTVTVPDAAPAPADPLAALGAELRQDFDAVCKRRESSRGAKNGAREAWLDADVETVRKVKEALGRTGAKTMASLLGMSADSVRDLLQRKSPAPVAAPIASDPFNQAKRRA